MSQHIVPDLDCKNVITIAYPGVRVCGDWTANNIMMISRQRKEEIISLFEHKIRGPGSTQEIRKISKEELEQTSIRLGYRNEDADVRMAVNDEIYQRKSQLQQKWLGIIILLFLAGLAVFFGKEFTPLLQLAP